MTPKRWALTFTSCLLMVFLAGIPAIQGADESATDNRKLASVNGRDIFQADLDKEMNRFEGQMGVSGQPPDPAQRDAIKKKVLDNLIQRELLFQESVRLEIKVGDDELSEQMTQLKGRFTSEEDFTNALKRLKMSEGDLREEFSRRLIVKKMIDQVIADKVQISAEETRNFYDNNPNFFKAPERVRASHILVKLDPNASESDKASARKKIEEIQKRIQKGEDFAAVAKAGSDCPSASKGGDLDYFQRGQMVAPFEEAAFSLKPGEVSGVVETQFGYHLIKVVDKKESGVIVYEEIKGDIESHLRQQKVNEQYAVYIEELKSKAKVEMSAP
ncbi:MAG: peptidylprolyl isomerase [Syntrophobacteraceae bacterium]|nr:peptidylprolyl isomerase [Syntrophobacteraceae bacterium]